MKVSGNTVGVFWMSSLSSKLTLCCAAALPSPAQPPEPAQQTCPPVPAQVLCLRWLEGLQPEAWCWFWGRMFHLIQECSWGGEDGTESGFTGLFQEVFWDTGRIFHLCQASKRSREQDEAAILCGSIHTHPVGLMGQPCPSVSWAPHSLAFPPPFPCSLQGDH